MNIIVIIFIFHLTTVTAEVPACQDDQRIVFTAEPADAGVQCGVNEVAIFPCRYEGSMALPQWVINSTVYGSLNSQLPPDHSYRNHMLSVMNIKLWQNTTYQCQVLYNNGPLFCAHRSSIGQLIITECIVINTESVISSPATASSIVFPTSTSSISMAISKANSDSIINHFKMMSSDSTGSVGDLPTPPSVTTKFSFIGAITIGIVCILIGIILLTIPLGVWYHKNSKCGIPCLVIQREINQENFYDEPTIPDPIYQEINASATNGVEMTKNYCYATAKSRKDLDSGIALQECPAYITHSTCSSVHP